MVPNIDICINTLWVRFSTTGFQTLSSLVPKETMIGKFSYFFSSFNEKEARSVEFYWNVFSAKSVFLDEG